MQEQRTDGVAPRRIRVPGVLCNDPVQLPINSSKRRISVSKRAVPLQARTASPTARPTTPTPTAKPPIRAPIDRLTIPTPITYRSRPTDQVRNLPNGRNRDTRPRVGAHVTTNERGNVQTIVARRGLVGGDKIVANPGVQGSMRHRLKRKPNPPARLARSRVRGSSSAVSKSTGSRWLSQILPAASKPSTGPTSSGLSRWRPLRCVPWQRQYGGELPG